MTLIETRVHELRPGDEWFQDNGWATITDVHRRGGPTDRVDIDFLWDNEPDQDNPWGGDIAIIKRNDPQLLRDEVFGFWHHGVWQPVLEGMTVHALPGGAVQFTYPPPRKWPPAPVTTDYLTTTGIPTKPRSNQPQTLLVGINESDCAHYREDHHVTLGPRKDTCAIWSSWTAPADGHLFNRIIYTNHFLTALTNHDPEAEWTDRHLLRYTKPGTTTGTAKTH